jgi:hypothetical protein
MLKKGMEITWTEEAKASSGNTPMLISLDYAKEFMVFSFSSKHTIVVVFL